jgi:hypothetical protein
MVSSRVAEFAESTASSPPIASAVVDSDSDCLLTFLEHLGPVDLDQTRVRILVFLPVVHPGRGTQKGCVVEGGGRSMAVRPCGRRKADSQLATLPNPAHQSTGHRCSNTTPPWLAQWDTRWLTGLWESHARAILTD